MEAIKAVENIVPHVARLTIYCTPQGKIIVPLGNQRISVTPDEARELLEDVLTRATRFSCQDDKLVSSNGHSK